MERFLIALAFATTVGLQLLTPAAAAGVAQANSFGLIDDTDGPWPWDPQVADD